MTIFDEQNMRIVLKLITNSVEIITVFTCIWYLLKSNSIQPYRFFATGWMVFLIHDIIMVIIGFINPVKNHWAYNIAFPLLLLFTMWFFGQLLHQRRVMILMVLFLIFAALNLFLIQGTTTLNTYSLALGGLIILLLSASSLYQLYKQETPESIFKEPAFWISSGFLFYWALATPFFTIYNFLWENFPDFFIFYFYTVNFFFICVLNLCIIKSLQCSLNTAKK
jgi:hypothetical protein